MHIPTQIELYLRHAAQAVAFWLALQCQKWPHGYRYSPLGKRLRIENNSKKFAFIPYATKWNVNLLYVTPNKRYMTKHFLVMSAVFFALNGQAQTAPQQLTIKGASIDSATGEPLGYVTVILQLAQNAKPIRKAVTKPDGRFVLTAPAGQ